MRAFRDLGDDHSGMLATRTLAWAHQKRRDLDRARTLHEENPQRARALDNESVEAVTMGALAMIAIERGEALHAVALLKQQLPIHRRLGNLLESVVDLCRVTRALSVVGRPRPAAVLVACTEALREEIGAMWSWAAKMNEETLDAVRAQLDEQTFAEAWEQGRALTLDDAFAFALRSLD